jgi:hypothetical protein
MRDFKMIDSAASIDQLRLRLKDNELEHSHQSTFTTPSSVFPASIT